MKRLSSRALVASLVGGLLGVGTASCSASATPPPPGGSGNNTSIGGNGTVISNGGNGTVISNGGNGTVISNGGNGTVISNGGNGTVISNGGNGTVISNGGNGTGGSGTVVGGGGSSGTGAGGDAATCSTDTNLVKATGCFVGCDPTLATDNPQGIQGAFYTFGDGTSCTPVNPPCSATGVCLTGTTAVDATFAKWGCGMGMELNATGGLTSMKQPLGATAASCFNYTLTGNSGGNEVRIAFTQTSDTTGRISPYVSIPAFPSGKTGTICTKDVTCQGQDPTKCALTGMSYDLQIEVVGGKNMGAYNVCLSSLTPATTGTSTLSQLCGLQGATDASEDVGKYFAQNNVNTPGDKLCMTPALKAPAASFKVDSAMFATGATLNAYPSLVDGWHYGRVSSDTALPKKMSALGSVTSSVSYAGSDGKYDAAYDIWVLPTLPSAAVKTPAGGLEVMMWLNAAGVNPAGTQTGTFNGWTVWVGTVQSWKYVAYQKNGQTTFTGDLKPFITDAISRSALGGDPYLAGVEFGFEFYDYPGTGFAVNSFTCDVK